MIYGEKKKPYLDQDSGLCPAHCHFACGGYFRRVFKIPEKMGGSVKKYLTLLWNLQLSYHK